jgi:predicted NBD/HSP70 family sugar kinase
MSVASMLDPARIVVGGPQAIGDGRLRAISRRLAERLPYAPEVRAAALGDDAALLGAAEVAAQMGRRWASRD